VEASVPGATLATLCAAGIKLLEVKLIMAVS
jgi:hypothetical protein